MQYDTMYMYTRVGQFTPFFLDFHNSQPNGYQISTNKSCFIKKKYIYIFSNCSRKCMFVQNSVTFLFIIQLERFGTQVGANFAKKSLEKVSS